MKEGDVMKIKVYHHVQGATFTTWEDAKVLIIFPEGVRIKWGDGTISMVEANDLI